MGDMKTPDFDDLLAAFDIPDIDAKEAIQSSPEEQREEGGTNDDGSPSCFPCSPASDSDRPLVSVIVKNTVRSESVEEEEKYDADKTEYPSSGDSAPRVQVSFNSQLVPKLTADPAAEPQMANGFKGSVPRDQGAWSLRPSTLNDDDDDDEGDRNKGAEVAPTHHTTDVMNSLKPLLFPQSLTSSSTPRSISPQRSPHSLQKEEACLLGNSSSSPLPQNGSIKVGFMHSDDYDSEPDLGSPLVIQESPESIMSSPPKFKMRSELLRSPLKPSRDISKPPNLSAKPKQLHEDKGHPRTPRSPTAAPQLQSTKDSLPSVITGSASVQEEKYPEHVIDERDSPESPPPSETGLVVPKSSSSPDLAKTPGLLVNPAGAHHLEELMDIEPSSEEMPGRTEELSEKMAGDREKLNEETSGAGTSSEDTMSAFAAEKDSSPLRPLKVKIKMRTGSITRTVTGVAPMRSARVTSRAVEGSKPSPERLNTKTKRVLPQRAPPPAVAMLQDVSAATAQAASTVKQKSAVDTKPKASPTAVSITKTAALPSVSPLRVGAGGINLRSLGQKTLNSGMILTTPSPLTSQSGSKPASIVNNTGAIISKSQTNLVEAFNKILNNKNLLPCYKPDLSLPLPAEWGIPLPAQGYRCLECGDAFALEQSLARHYDRRSLRIEVTCNHCAKRLAFFNKCSLLLHAREHKEKGLIMQCSHLVMKTVTLEQMIGQHEPTAIGGLSPSLLPSSAAQSSSSSGLVLANPTLQSHKVVTNKKVEEVQHINNKCPECLTQFSSKEEVAEHFQEIKPGHTSPCSECSPPMLLPNSCSAAAHQRIHQSCAPHVCPECGGTAKQPRFQTHLDETCLHFARRIGYRCSSCQVVFGGLNSVKSHIQQAHCDMFHKCPSCPMAFKSAPSIQNHITAQHPTLTEGPAILIYKCVMCDTVFTHKPLLYVHFDMHLINQKVHVFKCPECTKLFSQRNSLLDHFKTHIKTPTLKQKQPLPPTASSRPQPAVKLESSDADEWKDEDKEEKVKTKRMKTPSGWKCFPCHANYTERDDYITHMAEQHGKKLKKFPCNKCESSFTTTSSMRRHIRDKHKVMNRGFRCQFCTEGKKTFSTRALLERHVQLRHKDKVGHDTLLGGRDDADSSSEQDSNLGARRRRRGAVKTEHNEESTDGMTPVKKLRSTSSAPAAHSLPDSEFRCAPCGFATDDQTSFLEHISQHKRSGAEGGGLQCLQCGACFTSTSSLSRHRFIIHKMKDSNTDNQQALSLHPAPSPGSSRNHDDKSSLDCSAPPSPSSQKEEEDTLACKVCGKHFEKASDLNTHFRTHGMAFISARNAGKTT
ncbi:zinc finger protein 687a [Pleuronectes platessa]|uniref:zinc finger protein 687a n=1 Tax=Pleuronectes platessa TaxID=8262 RepID=UPI00232A3C4B|nr:zinc finger protein 687a [Pleuronectes platessa]